MAVGAAEYGAGVWLGETDARGVPMGRGTLTFPDGTRFSGWADGNAARGEGVWVYPDGSRLRGGFTLCREAPVFVFTDPAGRSVTRVLRYFVSDPEAPAVSPAERERSRAADRVCAVIAALIREYPGTALEFNARAILIDRFLSGGSTDAQIAACVRDLAGRVPSGGMIRADMVMDFSSE